MAAEWAGSAHCGFRRPHSVDEHVAVARRTARTTRDRPGSAASGRAVVNDLPDTRPSRVIVEGVRPSVDEGRFPAKGVVGTAVEVTADVFADGHDHVAAAMRYRYGTEAWREVPMRPLGNDRYSGSFRPDRIGLWEFTVVGWIDHLGTWVADARAKHKAAVLSSVDLQIGAELVTDTASRAGDGDRSELQSAAGTFKAGSVGTWLDDERLERAAWLYGTRRPLGALDGSRTVWVDRALAACSAWYEFFPRSTVDGSDRHATLSDAVDRLDRIAALGFDIVYLPPIHPIGETNRKGRNNSVKATRADVGSPWAIGGSEGGHTAVHSELGTVEDLRHLVEAARARGLEIALDIAFQCSPDHPWVHQHPEWFRHRPDGSIQYAENPPKRYEDIVPIHFENDDWKSLWVTLRDVFLFWIDQGVTVFRVDNPHTKPFAFWAWLIAEIRATHPETILLSESFTRPRRLQALAKLGFTQSYTYFAWRASATELTEYFTELTTETVDYLRPNAWPNTPDILTEQLQDGGRPVFASRAMLASTLSANWGVYGPAFELIEHVPIRRGSEEYRDSEKYQLRRWRHDQPRSLAPLLGRLNAIRRAHPALRQDRTLGFHPTDNPQLLAYSKTASEPGQDRVLCIVNLDPANSQGGWVNVQTHLLDLADGQSFWASDELGGGRYAWSPGPNYVRIEPGDAPGHILALEPR